jgi:GT2 family glycosyltransferase
MPMIEFVNPTGHSIVLAGPNGEQIHLKKFERRTMSDYFKKYAPRYLKIIKMVNTPPAQPRQFARPPIINPTQIRREAPTTRPTVTQQTSTRQNKPVIVKIKQSPVQRIVRSQIVGRTAMVAERATAYYRDLMSRIKVSISNDIGVGILSFNRKDSVSRLVESIRKFTDLSKTTVFISDESTDAPTKDYIRTIKDMVVLDNPNRLGVAGNTNRLLRCLERFRFKLILNDDVEIIASGWENLYSYAMNVTGYHHFCMRQPGICGATISDGIIQDIKGIKVQTIQEKPQGAIFAYDNVAHNTVGYFDENFGTYGMEHVDWSNRVCISGIQPHGFHDVIGSEHFFKLHSDKSAVEDRVKYLASAKKIFESVRDNKSRVYISPSDKSIVPTVSYIIPFRGIDRGSAIKVVLQNIKAQLFPAIEIVMAEQDSDTRISIPEFNSVKYVLAKANLPFTKALAFNLGSSKTTSKFLILHDADMLVQDDYTQFMYNLLQNHDGVHVGKSVLYLSNDATNRVVSTQKMANDLRMDRSVDYFEGGSLGCRRDIYINIGGFCEDFVGYGNEDCEFFDRLAKSCRFYNTRTYDFIHMWHGRTPGWKECHEKNKLIEGRLKRMAIQDRVAYIKRAIVKYGLITH